MKRENVNESNQLKKRTRREKFLYSCPRCCEPIFEHDILFIIDGKCYCLDCRRSPLFETKAFNIIGAQSTPSETQLIEIVKKAVLI